MSNGVFLALMTLRLFNSLPFNSWLRLRGVVAASAVPVGTGHDAFIDALRGFGCEAWLRLQLHQWELYTMLIWKHKALFAVGHVSSLLALIHSYEGGFGCVATLFVVGHVSSSLALIAFVIRVAVVCGSVVSSTLFSW